jgi:hypothetical protein
MSAISTPSTATRPSCRRKWAWPCATTCRCSAWSAA